MLQFGSTLCGASMRLQARFFLGLTVRQLKAVSSVTNPQLETGTQKKTSAAESSASSTTTKTSGLDAIFKDLKNTVVMENDVLISTAIRSAKTLEDLLNITSHPDLTVKDGLKVITILTKWVADGKVNFSDFEKDHRYVALCTTISGNKHSRKSTTLNKNVQSLTTIIGQMDNSNIPINLSGLSIQDMVSAMTALAMQKRRSVPLLTALAFNIGKNEGILTIKQSADLLYAMAILNFPDRILLEKACLDLQHTVPGNKKSSVIGSIMTSLGILRYKDEMILNLLCNWMVKNYEKIRPQEITSLLLTSAIVGHTSEHLQTIYEMVINNMDETHVSNSMEWLNVVWSSVILNNYKTAHVASVLDPKFVSNILNCDSPSSVSKKLKLLNINAAAQYLLQDYDGPLLAKDSPAFDVTLMRSKESEKYVQAVLDTLQQLLPSTKYYTANTNTGMGFLIDVECWLDKNCNPIQLSTEVKDEKIARIAIMSHLYNDFCKHSHEPTGVNKLYNKLLTAKGYCVMIVPYNNFNVRDKIVTRVKYLNQQFRAVLAQMS